MSSVPAALRRARVVLPVLVGTLLLAACGSTGSAGTGTTTVVGEPTAMTTLPATTADVDLVVDRRKAGLKAASKAFAKCDSKVSADSYSAYRCLKQLRAQTALAEDLSAELGALQLPMSYVTIAANVAKLAAAGAAAEAKCAKVADQKCDQALAKFRADQQSVVWDLGL